MKLTGVMRSNKGRLLFVEDENSLVEMYQSYFEQKGYDFLATKDIQEALDLTMFERPDVVLLDIIIPKKEHGMINVIAEQGYDYLEKKKKDQKIKDIPVVVFTNLDTTEDRIRCAELGAVAYLFKGQAMPKDVLATVEAVIKRYGKQDQKIPPSLKPKTKKPKKDKK